MCLLRLPRDLLWLLGNFLSRAEIVALRVAWGNQADCQKFLKLLARSILQTKAQETIEHGTLQWYEPDDQQSASFAPISLGAHYARLNSEWERVVEAVREYARGTTLGTANSDFRHMYLHCVKMRPGRCRESVYVVSVEIDDKPCVLVLAQTQQCMCIHDTSYSSSTWDARCFHGCPAFVTVHIVRPQETLYNLLVTFGYQPADGRVGPVETTFPLINKVLSHMNLKPTSLGMAIHAALALTGVEIRGRSPSCYVDIPMTPVCFFLSFSCAVYNSQHIQPVNSPEHMSDSFGRGWGGGRIGAVVARQQPMGGTQ